MLYTQNSLVFVGQDICRVDPPGLLRQCTVLSFYKQVHFLKNTTSTPQLAHQIDVWFVFSLFWWDQSDRIWAMFVTFAACSLTEYELCLLPLLHAVWQSMSYVCYLCCMQSDRVWAMFVTFAACSLTEYELCLLPLLHAVWQSMSYVCYLCCMQSDRVWAMFVTFAACSLTEYELCLLPLLHAVWQSMSYVCYLCCMQSDRVWAMFVTFAACSLTEYELCLLPLLHAVWQSMSYVCYLCCMQSDRVWAMFVTFAACSNQLSHNGPDILSWKGFKECIYRFDGLMQDCSNSSALAMELLQSCTKPSIYIKTLWPTRINKVIIFCWANVFPSIWISDSLNRHNG